MREMLTPGKAAELLGLKPGTIRLWLRSGKLDGMKIGSVWRVRLEEINRLLLAAGAPSPKLSRIPEPIIRLQLEDGQAVSIVETTDDLLLIAVNGKPRVTIDPIQLPALLRELVG